MPRPGSTLMHPDTQSLRLPVAVLAVALLIAGVVLGHPDMSFADNCTGSYDIGCSDASCDAFCAARTGGGVPCVRQVCNYAGFCFCMLDP